MRCTEVIEDESQVQVQNVLRGTQQAESHTQYLGTEALREPPHMYPFWTVPPGRCTAARLMRKWLVASMAGRHLEIHHAK